MITLRFMTLLAVALFCNLASGSILINEIDSDTPGPDALEFIELAGTPNMSLDGLSLIGVNGGDDRTYPFAFDLDGYSTDENGLFLLANSGVAGADIIFSDNTFQNGPDALVLFTGDASAFPDDSAPPVRDSIVDVVHYGTDDSADIGLSALYPSAGYVDEGLGGARDTQSIGRGPNGFRSLKNPTPNAVNVVPEPSYSWLMLISLAWLVRRRF